MKHPGETDVFSASTAGNYNNSVCDVDVTEIGSSQTSNPQGNIPTTPAGNSTLLHTYKERLRKSKERNASLRKKLFEVRGEKRKLLEQVLLSIHVSFRFF